MKHPDPDIGIGILYGEGSRSAMPQYDTARWQISEHIVAHLPDSDHFHRVPSSCPVANLFSAHLQLSDIKYAGLGEAKRGIRTVRVSGS